MTSLYHKCAEFHKLSEGLNISVKPNTNPILKELSDIKSFDDRIEFAKKHWEWLGEGSSRTAFQMNDDLIIKIAHNEKGIYQDKTEMDPKAQCICVNPVLLADAAGKWIIMRNTEKLSEKKFKELIGFGFDTFMNALFYKFNNESDKWSKPRDYEDIEKNALFNCLADLIFKTDQQIGDLDKISSWRELDGRPVLVDYGLSKDVYKKFYDDDDSTTSNSTTKTST